MAIQQPSHGTPWHTTRWRWPMRRTLPLPLLDRQDMAGRNDCLELAVCASDPGAARTLARTLGGTLYVDPRSSHAHLPFRALVTCVSDDLDSVGLVADVGLYLVCRRLIKAGKAEAVALFPMVRRSELTHEQADAHWRDRHAPLTFEHHQAMSQYRQLSVVHRFSGPELDGIALCGFSCEADLREKFFTHASSAEVIAADVAKFADLRRSPRRLVAQVTNYSHGEAIV